jgi:hypothetical protein
MKYTLLILIIALSACDDTEDSFVPQNEAIVVDGDIQHCAMTDTAIAWDDEGQDYIITYCSCPITYEGQGPQQCLAKD